MFKAKTMKYLNNYTAKPPIKFVFLNGSEIDGEWRWRIDWKKIVLELKHIYS